MRGTQTVRARVSERTQSHACGILLAFSVMFFGSVRPLQAQNTSAARQNAEQSDVRFVRISEILISTADSEDRSEIAAARNTAEQLLIQIKAGRDFADIARANSQGPSAGWGGDVGYFGHGDLAHSLEDIVFRLPVGGVSDVIRTRQGFVIIKVTDRRNDATRPSVSGNSTGSSLPPELEDYKANVVRRIQEAWYQLIPVGSRQKSGTLFIQLSVGRDGSVRNPRIALSSGLAELDAAALNAVVQTAPYPPLPKTIKSDSQTFRLRFEYNPKATTPGK
jgi:TonB family protein